jgi:cellulose synthase/poly-beta-1,6-N-acetylglucosamine synthase-like glycosyltransferase
MAVVVIEALSAMAVGVKKTPPDGRGSLPNSVILIPAHNEQDLIRQTLDSLLPTLWDRCRALCVAHNCTDETARVARNSGADVVEVDDDGSGGKPDALKGGLRSLDADPPDVVVVIDADCLVYPGSISLLASSAYELNRPVMGAYLFAPAGPTKGLGQLSSLAVLLKNYVRPLGLHSLGLPCLLNGSGSAYPFEVIRNAPHGEGSIAEDYQLAIDLLKKGYPTEFVPQARVDGQLPKREDTALRQRRRWEHGQLLLAFKTAPRLLLSGLVGRDVKRIAIAFEVLVPPLAFLGLIWFLSIIASLGIAIGYGYELPLIFSLTSGGLFAAAVLASWMRFAGVRPTFRALAAVPNYLVWKLPMYRDYFTRRETRWKKTERD